jgi:hypothetical protein
MESKFWTDEKQERFCWVRTFFCALRLVIGRVVKAADVLMGLNPPRGFKLADVVRSFFSLV